MNRDVVEQMDRLAADKNLNRGPCVLLCLTSSIRIFADSAPVLWKAKGAYLAWPTEVPIDERGARASDGTDDAAGGSASAAWEGEGIEQALARLQGVKAADYLSDVARMHLRGGSTESARAFLIRAAQIYGDNASLDGMARTYGLLASVAMGRGDCSAAVDWLEQAEDNWRVLGDAEGLSNNLAQRGHAEFLMGRLDRAARVFKEALEVDKAREDNRRIAAGYRRMGMVLERIQKYRSAEGLYQQALALEKVDGCTRGMARTLMHLGRLALVRKDYAKAEEALETALKHLENREDPSAASAVLHQIGNVHLARNRLEEAMATYRRSIALEEAHGDLLGLTRTTAQLALALEESGDLPAALHQYIKAHFYASKIKFDFMSELADKVTSIESKFPAGEYNRILALASKEAGAVMMKSAPETSKGPKREDSEQSHVRDATKMDDEFLW